MATPAAPAKGGGLKRKIGPLPIWAWAGVAGGAVGIWWVRKKKAAAAAAGTSSTGQAATVGAAGQPFASTGDGGGGFGGGSGGGGTSPGGGAGKWNKKPPPDSITNNYTTNSTALTTSNVPNPAEIPAAAAPSVTVGGTTAAPGSNVPTITNPNQSSAAPEAAPTISGIGNQGTELALVNRGFDVYALASNGQYVPVIQNGLSVKPPAGTTIGSGRYYEPTQTGTKSLSKPLSKLP